MSASAAIGWAAGLDPKIWQAILGGGFLALGWFVNGWQNRRRAERLRLDTVRDVQLALRAEIRAYVAVLKRDDLQVYGEQLARRIEAEPDFFPIIPTENNETVFKAIVPTIHLLPEKSVDPVVLYYSQLAAIGAMIDDLRAIDLQRVGVVRAAAMYRDYIAMKVEAIVLGEDALEMITAHLDGAEARQAEIEQARVDAEASRLTGQLPELGAWIRNESAKGKGDVPPSVRTTQSGSPVAGRSGQ